MALEDNLSFAIGVMFAAAGDRLAACNGNTALARSDMSIFATG